MLTNLQLVEYMEKVFAAKWVYWYGTCGYECTDSLLKRKTAQYPSHYTAARESGYKKDINDGKMCSDCVGVIKSFFWTGGVFEGKNTYASNNCPDRSANGLFSMCTETGDIASMPDIYGLVVWKNGHIGVYVGDGKTIEMQSYINDCVMKDLKDGTWEKWGRLPDTMIAYVSEPVKEWKLGERELKIGDEGQDVVELQEHLKSLGYDLGSFGENKDGIDGEYGEKTQAAVMMLQNTLGLAASGVYDAPTHKALIDLKDPLTPPIQEDVPDGGS
ncbi:MAG: peptidoglycan-binding protein, partial [Clostridiales bacterium]|nr:peptidoglycan-binding protein [Clostridiales bacterium]